MSDQPLVYLILGAAGSGRREVLADLIDGGLTEADRAAVLLSAAEAPDDLDARLPGLARWTWTGDAIDGTLPMDATHVFLVTDGHRNPVDQLEAGAAWIAAQGAELGRILCVVNCQLAEKHPALLPWFEACVNFCERWDQASFDPEYPTEPLERFEPLVRAIFTRPAHDVIFVGPAGA